MTPFNPTEAAMPKTRTTEAPAPVEPETSLAEWCSAASATDRRVELLNAFARIETTAGRVKATAAEFADRYAAFANRPV